MQRRCLTAEMFWRVGIARNAVFFHSFVASKARKGSSEKRELRRVEVYNSRVKWLTKVGFFMLKIALSILLDYKVDCLI